MATRRDGEAATTTVTLTNSGGGSAPAFFVEATLRRPDGTPVLPVSWSDDDVTLWPGESTTLTARYRASELGAGQPAVDVSGFNVDRVRA